MTFEGSMKVCVPLIFIVLLCVSCGLTSPATSELKGEAEIPRRVQQAPPVQRILEAPVTLAWRGDAGLRLRSLPSGSVPNVRAAAIPKASQLGGQERYIPRQMNSVETPISYFLHKFRENNYLAQKNGMDVNLERKPYRVWKLFFPRDRTVLWTPFLQKREEYFWI